MESVTSFALSDKIQLRLSWRPRKNMPKKRGDCDKRRDAMPSSMPASDLTRRRMRCGHLPGAARGSQGNLQNSLLSYLRVGRMQVVRPQKN